MAQIIAGGTKPDSGGNVEVITQTQTTTWVQLQGKPYIAVSSKGIFNGLSTIPNDGADFGPDTTLGATALGQYGGTYTTTTGIQEAINYSYSTGYVNLNNMPVKVMLSSGKFTINDPISLSPVSAAYQAVFELYGSGENTTTIYASGASSFFTIGNSTLGNITFHDIAFWEDNSSTASYFISSTNLNNVIQLWFDNSAIQLGNNSITFLNLPSTGDMEINFVNSVLIGNVTFTGSEPVPITFLGSLIGQTGNVFTFDLSHSKFVNFFGSWLAGNINITDQPALLNIIGTLVSSIAGSYFITTVGGSIIYILNSTLSFSTSSTGYVVYTSNGNTFVKMEGGYVAGGSSIYLCQINTDAYYEQNSSYSNVSGMAGLGTIGNPGITPTVPASGTALSNSQLYPITVYIYGGTVTEIQIVRGGNTYTVFSNSTGLALSGQSYDLGPEDSITITYTTAPTWEWAPVIN